MKKILLVTSFLGSYLFSLAQTDSLKPIIPKQPVTKKDWSKVNVSNRASDHLVLQIGYDGWAGKPDSIKTKGFQHSVNVAFMLDFPFKTDPRFSVGLGAGASGGSVYFSKTNVLLAGPGTKLVFKNVADTNNYKKTKLAITYLEVPLELRFANNPENMNKSWKFGLGAKIGTMINAHTKNKNLQNKAGSTLNAYTMKESSKRFFNSTRLAGTARIGYGVFSIFGTYQINNFLKDGAGPDIHPYSVGLQLSGL